MLKDKPATYQSFLDRVLFLHTVLFLLSDEYSGLHGSLDLVKIKRKSSFNSNESVNIITAYWVGGVYAQVGGGGGRGGGGGESHPSVLDLSINLHKLVILTCMT